jgi:hydrogenase/urease accessory protein HupE
MRPAFGWVSRFLLALFFSTAQPLAAHVVKQLYGEFRTDSRSWQLEILFDAGYADPATRNDAAAPQPTRDWLVGLPPAEQRRLCQEAETYLRESLGFRSAAGFLEWKISFPDFKTSPPDFPSLLNDGAYFHALIEPAGGSGTVFLSMAGGDHPDLVVKMPSPAGEETTYLTVPPGGEMVLFTKEAEPSAPVMAEKGQNLIAVAFQVGVKHVLGGLDHLLFVLGIFLLQRRWLALLKQSLAFTAAHTITLGLASLGWVDVPRWIVEPMIALSITALAVENLFVKEARGWRLWLVFAFGLIHGLGFAGALSAWIRPGEGFLPALISANLGVEAGQIVVLFLAWSLTMGWSESKAWPHFRRWACVGLAMAGLVWFGERVKLYHSSVSSSGSSPESVIELSPHSMSTRLRFQPLEMASCISS